MARSADPGVVSPSIGESQGTPDLSDSRILGGGMGRKGVRRQRGRGGTALLSKENAKTKARSQRQKDGRI